MTNNERGTALHAALERDDRASAMTADELATAHGRAEMKLRGLRTSRQAELERVTEYRTADLRRQLDAVKAEVAASVADQYDGPIAAAAVDVIDAKAALDAARIAEANADTGWYPVGTPVVEWRPPRHYEATRAYSKLGRGVVEVWGEKSLHPANMAEFRLPRPGAVVVRQLKRDGTPSTRWVALTSYTKSVWLREGVDKNAEVKS